MVPVSHTSVALLLAAVLAVPVRGSAAPPRATPPPPPPVSEAPSPAIPEESPPPTPTLHSDAPAPVDDGVESVFDLGLDGDVPPPPEESGPEMEPAPPTAEVDTHDPVPTPVDQPAKKHRTPPTRVGVAGWSLLLGSFAVGAGASVFVGFAERERTRARRIGVAYDLFTDMPRPLPEDIAGVLAKSKASRRLYTRVALGLGAGAGALLLTSVALLAADAVKRKRARERTARVRVDGLRVWF